ncbi:MAG: hypothetical protein C4346_09490 [Chloroflexota bacterium]
MNGLTAGIGRVVARLAVVTVLVMVVLGLAHGEVGAETKVKGKVSVSANEYADICDDAGAETITVRKNNKGDTIVTCTWDDGFQSKCNFTTKTCVDTLPMRVLDDARNGVAVNGAGMIQTSDGNSGGTGTTPTKVGRGQQAVASGDLTLDNERP